MQDSWPYKRELADFAASFERRLARQVWRDDSVARAEKMLFVGFLYVRKLIEYRRVTDATARASVEILRSTITRSREVSDFRREDLEKDLPEANWSDSRVDVQQLADKVIHSWWLVPVQGPNTGLYSFILTTDRQRNAELWQLPVSSIVAVYRRFAEDDIVQLHARRDGKGHLTYWSAT